MTRPSEVSSRTCLRVAGAGAAVLAAGLLGACSGGATTAPTTPAPLTSTATVTSTAQPPAGSSSPAGGGSNSGGSNSGGSNSGGSNSGGSNSGGETTHTSAYCKESQLRASIASTRTANGDRAVIVDFRNTSNSTCVLYGYPGAAVLDSAGKQVTEAKRTLRGRTLGYAPGHDTLVHVSLEPGQVANAGIEGVDEQEQGAAQAGCDADPNPQIEITPPNTSIPVPFDVTWPICYSFNVHPVNYAG